MVKQDLKPTFTYLPPTNIDDILGDFCRNHRSYQEFMSKGLDKIYAGVDRDGKPWSIINKILDRGLFKRHLRFLSLVDLNKGPIRRRVDRLERRRDLNPETYKSEEHLVAHTYWVAKDYNGNDIQSAEVLEGMYNNPKTKTILENGKRVTKYEIWDARYDILFTPDAVDDILKDNINPPELINYFVRVSKRTRDDTFTLTQFRDTTWEEAVGISNQGKGQNK